MTAPPHESQGHHQPSFTSADNGADDPEVEARAADRVVVFSDAVVAIAITLLALDLPVPDSTSTWTNAQFWHSLTQGHTRSEYFAFLLSFLIIGSNWAAHRRTFRYVNRLNVAVGRLNMAWLLMMVVTPFAARLLAADGALGIRFAIYTLIQVIASTCLMQINRQVGIKSLLRPNAPARARYPNSMDGIALIAVFLVSIPVAFAIGAWAFALWAAVPVLSRVLRRRLASGRHTTG